MSGQRPGRWRPGLFTHVVAMTAPVAMSTGQKAGSEGKENSVLMSVGEESRVWVGG